jgi:precorrin-6B methylase 1
MSSGNEQIDKAEIVVGIWSAIEALDKMDVILSRMDNQIKLFRKSLNKTEER